jgi:3-hydroxyacyl-CoA dehydrogenase
MWQFSLAAASIVLAATAMAVSCLKNEQKKEVPPVPAHNNSENDRKVLVVGCGTIGSGFASVFLAKGKKIVCIDEAVPIEILKQRVRECWPFLVARGIAQSPEPPFENLEKKDILENAAKDVDFVQECVFEDVDIKRTVLAKLDSLVDPAVIIASSTSFIPWTLLFEHCKHQHRLVIGHPAIPYMHS